MAILVLIHTESFIDRASKKVVIFFYSTNFEEYSNIYDFFFSLRFVLVTHVQQRYLRTYVKHVRFIERGVQSIGCELDLIRRIFLNRAWVKYVTHVTHVRSVNVIAEYRTVVDNGCG